MVAPLAALGAVWDRRDWAGRVLHARTVTLSVGGRGWRLALGSLLAGVVLLGMGALTVVIAFSGQAMGTSGWRERTAADLGHWAAVVTKDLSWVPGWAVTLILVAAVVAVVRHLRRHRNPTTGPGGTVSAPAKSDVRVASASPDLSRSEPSPSMGDNPETLSGAGAPAARSGKP